MKKAIMFATAVVLLSACHNDELDRANRQRDSLMTVLNNKNNELNENESAMNEFVNSFNEVERNLDSVSARQQIISHTAEARKSGDLKLSQKERINANINAINELMENNRKTIAELKGRLKQYGNKNAKLEKLVASLQEQVQQKDAELAALNQKLNELNAQVATLNSHVDSLSKVSTAQGQTINENTMAMHTAYYVVGKRKQLEESKVIDRSGGVLGLGKSSRLSSNFDNNAFTKIDYTSVSSIPVNSKNAKLVTSHPAGTYRMEMDPSNKKVCTTLLITNPEKFWSSSKYLVIEGDPISKDNSMSAGNTGDGKKL